MHGKRVTIVVWLLMILLEAIVFPAQASKPGHVVITESNAKSLRLYKVIGTRIVTPLPPRVGTSTIGLQFSPQSDLIAFNTYLDHNTLRIWDIESGKAIAALSQYDSEAREAVFSPTGNVIYTKDSHYVLRVWDIATQHSWIFSDGGIDSNIALSKDGKLIAVGSSSEFWVIDTQSRKTLQYVKWWTEGRWATIRQVLFNNDATQLLVITDDSVPERFASVILFDIKTGTRIREIQGNQEIAEFFAFLDSSGGWLVVSAHYIKQTNSYYEYSFAPKRLYVWNLDTGQSYHLFQFGEMGGFTEINFNSIRNALGIEHKGYFKVCYLTGTFCQNDDWIPGEISSIFGLDGSIVISNNGIWSVQTKRLLYEFANHPAADYRYRFPLSIGLSPDGTLIATLSINGTVSLWTVPTN